MTSYPGGKGQPGIAQWIIRFMPVHDWYIEAFVGGGSVFRAKPPAPETTLIDLSGSALAKFNDVRSTESQARSTLAGNGGATRPAAAAIAEDSEVGRPRHPRRGSTNVTNGDTAGGTVGSITDSGVEVLQTDAILWLEHNAHRFDDRTLIYCDPPYPPETRVKTRVYDHEMSPAQHDRLLAILKELPAKILVSSYFSRRYAKALAEWHVLTRTATTRGGKRVEHLWLNFQP